MATKKQQAIDYILANLPLSGNMRQITRKINAVSDDYIEKSTTRNAVLKLEHDGLVSVQHIGGGRTASVTLRSAVPQEIKPEHKFRYRVEFDWMSGSLAIDKYEVTKETAAHIWLARRGVKNEEKLGKKWRKSETNDFYYSADEAKREHIGKMQREIESLLSRIESLESRIRTSIERL